MQKKKIQDIKAMKSSIRSLYQYQVIFNKNLIWKKKKKLSVCTSTSTYIFLICMFCLWISIITKMSIIAYSKPALTKPALKLIVFGVKREQMYIKCKTLERFIFSTCTFIFHFFMLAIIDTSIPLSKRYKLNHWIVEGRHIYRDKVLL